MEISIREKGFSLVLTIMQCGNSPLPCLSISVPLTFDAPLRIPNQLAYLWKVLGRGGKLLPGACTRLAPERRRKVATMLYAN